MTRTKVWKQPPASIIHELYIHGVGHTFYKGKFVTLYFHNLQSHNVTLGGASYSRELTDLSVPFKVRIKKEIDNLVENVSKLRPTSAIPVSQKMPSASWPGASEITLRYGP